MSHTACREPVQQLRRCAVGREAWWRGCGHSMGCIRRGRQACRSRLQQRHGQAQLGPLLCPRAARKQLRFQCCTQHIASLPWFSYDSRRNLQPGAAWRAHAHIPCCLENSCMCVAVLVALSGGTPAPFKVDKRKLVARLVLLVAPASVVWPQLSIHIFCSVFHCLCVFTVCNF